MDATLNRLRDVSKMNPLKYRPKLLSDILSPNRPAFPLMPLEAPRAAAEFALLAMTRPLLRSAPIGDGHPVVVCPGFMASDSSTRVLRQFLRDKQYRVYGWELGRNLGLKTTGDGGEKLAEHVMKVYRRTHRRVTLVGWSLGGVMAREVAKQMPDPVRQVITLGSPITGEPGTSNIQWLYERVTGHTLGSSDPTMAEFEANLKNPPEFVPSTSIYSKTDGIVHWRTCMEPKRKNTDNIEVYASHCGMGFHPAVFAALADRLALPDGEWRPFDRKSSQMRKLIFPSSGH